MIVKLGSSVLKGASSSSASKYDLPGWQDSAPIATEGGEIPPRVFGLALSRSLDGGAHEDLDLVNHGMKLVRRPERSPKRATNSL